MHYADSTDQTWFSGRHWRRERSNQRGRDRLMVEKTMFLLRLSSTIKESAPASPFIFHKG